MPDFTEVTDRNYREIAQEFGRGGYIIMPDGGGLSAIFSDFGFDLAQRGRIYKGNHGFRFNTAVEKLWHAEGEAGFVVRNEGNRSYLLYRKKAPEAVQDTAGPQDYQALTRDGKPDLGVYRFMVGPYDCTERGLFGREGPTLFASDQGQAVAALLRSIDIAARNLAREFGMSDYVLSERELESIGIYVAKDLEDGQETQKARAAAERMAAEDDAWTRRALKDGTFLSF